MWKAGAATAWCRWVQRDAAPTDSAMQHREGRSLSCGVLNKASFYLCCWSPACAIQGLLSQKLASEGLPVCSSSGSHSAVVLQSLTGNAKMGSLSVFKDLEFFLELFGEKKAFSFNDFPCLFLE